MDQKNCDITLMELINRTISSIDRGEEIFDGNLIRSLLGDLLDLLESYHKESITVNTIALNTIGLTNNNGKYTLTFLDLTRTKNISNGDDLVKDTKDIGVLLLSIFVGLDNVKANVTILSELPTYYRKFDYIYSIVKNANWILPIHIYTFADLILCLMNAQLLDTPEDFKFHPYFWTDDMIKRFLDKCNGRIRMSQDGRSKNQKRAPIVYVRNQMFLECMKKNFEFRVKLGNKLEKFYPTENTWNAWLNWIKNTISHDDDETASESEYIEDNKPIQAINDKPKKDNEALTKMTNFIDNEGGPLNYFLTRLDNFLYLLYDHFRLYADHPKMEEFYRLSFRFVEPKVAFEQKRRELGIMETNNKKEVTVTDEAGPSSSKINNTAKSSHNKNHLTKPENVPKKSNEIMKELKLFLEENKEKVIAWNCRKHQCTNDTTENELFSILSIYLHDADKSDKCYNRIVVPLGTTETFTEMQFENFNKYFTKLNESAKEPILIHKDGLIIINSENDVDVENPSFTSIEYLKTKKDEKGVVWRVYGGNPAEKPFFTEEALKEAQTSKRASVSSSNESLSSKKLRTNSQ